MAGSCRRRWRCEILRGSLSSMAFCPMRLREQNSRQTISLNPFGSYYGKQFDCSHLGGNGNGTIIMQAFSGALAPNGPSFNGETLQFSLMLAPYSGDKPSQEIQNAASVHFYPPGVIVHSALPEMNAVTIDDIEGYIESEKGRSALQADAPPMPPTAFLANPSANAVDLVWDAPRDGRVMGFEIEWRYENESIWQSLKIAPLTRWHMDGLEDGKPTRFRIRTQSGNVHSEWTDEQTCIPGAVTDSSVFGMLGRMLILGLVKVIFLSLWSLVRARFSISKS